MLKFTYLLVVVCLLVSLGETSFGQANKQKEKVSGEGVIIAYQKRNRHSVTPAMGGIATPVEFWIVRIDKWANETNKNLKYILVEFNLYERAVSDSEINSNKLRFTLRERRADEHTDCLGSISVGNRRYAKFRPVRFSDYQRTKPGNADKIPLLKSLSCFIADEPPSLVAAQN
jgi:hypothetical protein